METLDKLIDLARRHICVYSFARVVCNPDNIEELNVSLARLIETQVIVLVPSEFVKLGYVAISWRDNIIPFKI